MSAENSTATSVHEIKESEDSLRTIRNRENQKLSKQFMIQLSPMDIDTYIAKVSEYKRAEAAAVQIKAEAEAKAAGRKYVPPKKPKQNAKGPKKKVPEPKVEHFCEMVRKLTPELTCEIRADYGNTTYESKKINYVCVRSRLLQGQTGNRSDTIKHYTVYYDIPALKKTKHRSSYRCGPHKLDKRPWAFPNFLLFDKLRKYCNQTTKHLDVKIRVVLVYKRFKRCRELTPKGERETRVAKRHKLSDITEEMFISETASDFTILFDGPDAPIRCHKCILAANSKKFLDLFNKSPEKNSTVVEDIPRYTMYALIKYMYTREFERSISTRISVFGPVIPPPAKKPKSGDEDVEMKEQSNSSEVTVTTSVVKANASKAGKKSSEVKEMTSPSVDPLVEIKSDCEKLFIVAAEYRVVDLCIECMDLILSHVDENPIVIISCVRLLEKYHEFEWVRRYERDVMNFVRMRFNEIKDSPEFDTRFGQCLALRLMKYNL